MNETLISRIKSDRGFSLTELLIATGVAVFVSVGVGLIIVEQQDVETSTNFQANLDQSHNLALQKIRNVKEVSKALGITDSTGAALAKTACFGKSGTTDCSVAVVPDAGPVPPFFTGDVNTNACADPPTCFVQYSITYQMHCVTTRCESIDFFITTKPTTQATTRNKFAKERSTKISMPGFLFADKTAVNFSCGSSESTVPLTIDFKTLIMTCGPTTMTSASCSGNMPMRFYTGSGAAVCQTGETTANKSCPSGMQRIGLFLGQVPCS